MARMGLNRQAAWIRFALCVLVAWWTALSPAAAQTKQIQARVTQRVNNSILTKLKGSTPPLTALAQDQGVLQDSTPVNRMLLVLKRSDAQEVQLQQTIAELHDPSASTYHQWLTPGTFGTRFGVADADIQVVTKWLASQGFSVNKISHGKTAIEFSGTAGQLRSAFHTELHTYRHKGVVFHSNNQDPQIPTALAPVVAGLAATNDIPPSNFGTLLGKANFNAKTHEAVPQWTYPLPSGSTYLAAAPGDLAVQYNINPLYQAGVNGAGVTIGIISQAGVDNTVIAHYRSLFGLPDNLPAEIIDGADPGINGDGAGIEADLDVEVAGAVAPYAQLLLYTGQDTLTSIGLLNASLRAVEDNEADILSVSYGVCEPTLGLAGNLFFNQLWSQAAAQGQSVFVASGDSGAAGCDNGASASKHGLAVNGMSSTPHNVSVGGTDFYYSDYADSVAAREQVKTYWNTTGSSSPTVSLLQRIPEQPWNNAFGLNYGGTIRSTTTAAGGGGPSNCIQGIPGTVTDYFTSYVSCTGGYAKPAWQNAPGVPNDGVRDTPDISLFAASGANFSFYPICVTTTDCTAAGADPSTGAVQITGVGGTSASTPLMAGIMALVVQQLNSRQGNPNFVLYALARQVPSVFHDVTAGNNNVPCTQSSADCGLDMNADGYYTLQKYQAGAGYDLATGLGSIDAYALIMNWSRISFSPTVTTLSLSSTTFAHGTPVTVTSVVGAQGGTPSGVVSLVAVSVAGTQTSVGSITLSNGTGQATLNSLPAGTYTLTAQYGGDGTFAASSSNPVTLTVTPEDAKIEISGQYYGVTSAGHDAPAAPLVDGLTTLYGSYFYIDARVFGASSSADAPDGAATGTVTLYDNGAEVRTLNLTVGGFAELSSGSFAAGTHVLTFRYSGDGSFNPATSAPFTIHVTKGIAQIIISYAIPSGLPAGGTLKVPVEVTSAAGQLPCTGTITVRLGDQSQVVQLSQANLWGYSAIGYGTATFDISKTGTYVLDASYSGDDNLAPIDTAFNPSTLTIYADDALARTVTTVTLSSTTVDTANDSLTATVKVTGNGPVPTGYVTLFQNGNFVSLLSELDETGSVAIDVPMALVSNGSIEFLAEYNGDHYNSPSLSEPVTATVNLGSYSLTTSHAQLAIPSGGTGTALIGVGAPFAQRLTGEVSLHCETSSPLLACSFSSESLTLPSDPALVATSLLTITTQTHAAAAAPGGLQGALGGGGVVVALVLFVGVPLRERRRLATLRPAVFAWIAAALMISGCGGDDDSSVATTPTTPGIAQGTYTVTVTAVSSGVTRMLILRVVVADGSY